MSQSSVTHLNNWVNCYKLFIAYTNIRSLRWSRVTRWMSHVTWLIWIVRTIQSKCSLHTQIHKGIIPHGEWVVPFMNQSGHVWMSHLFIDDMKVTCHIWTSYFTYARVMSHMNQSCHVWMSHEFINDMNESCHISMSHVIYEWVLSRMNESSHVCTRTSTCQHVRTRQSERRNLHVWGGYD
jgi:hypothetical protein